MSIKSDRWIRDMAENNQMIEPFEPGQIRENHDKKIENPIQEKFKSRR